MNPALNGSSVLERFKCGDAIEIWNGIMFDFYPGLPHIYIFLLYEFYTFLCNHALRVNNKKHFRSGNTSSRVAWIKTVRRSDCEK